MSILDAFDPDSEEIVKACLQRSFRPAEQFPETVIMTFKEETFRILPQVCRAESVDVLREGRTIPVYGLRWRERELGIVQSLVGDAEQSGKAQGGRLYRGGYGVRLRDGGGAAVKKGRTERGEHHVKAYQSL